LVPTLAQAVAAAEGTPTPQGTPDNGLTYDQAKQKLERVLLQTERVRGQLDRTQFDVAALGANVGLDPSAASGVVHDEIEFEQYPGLLRGARGTLLSRAGNALDQAVLLWTLLNGAGYKVRIDHGTLTTDQAQVLVAQLAAPRKPAPAQGNIE